MDSEEEFVATRDESRGECRDETPEEKWARLMAEYVESMDALETAYLSSPPELEKPTTSSRTRKCPRGIGAVQAVL